VKRVNNAIFENPISTIKVPTIKRKINEKNGILLYRNSSKLLKWRLFTFRLNAHVDFKTTTFTYEAIKTTIKGIIHTAIIKWIFPKNLYTSSALI
jgi:hypothetical protein